MRKTTKLLFLLIFIFVLASCSNNNTNSNNDTNSDTVNLTNNNNNETEEFNLSSQELDELQQLYIDVDEESSYDEIIELIENTNLHYQEKEFDSGLSIKAAKEEGATKFKHADSGDYFKVSFTKDEMEIETIEYLNTNKFITLFKYYQGTYWEFRDQPNYAGYYINTYNNKAGEFEIEYDNGNVAQTDYLKVDSIDEQFKYFFNYDR